jgi:hypothetical protein
MTTKTLIPPAAGPYSFTIYGRTYSSTVDVPVVVPDFDANVMLCNGWKEVSTPGLGQAGGAAQLASTGKVPTGQLPSVSVAGNATLVGGTVTVADTTITANTVIIPHHKTIIGDRGVLTITRSVGVSFTFTSDQATDLSVIGYIKQEP